MLRAIRDVGFRFGKVKPYDEVEADKVLVLNFDEEGNFTNTELEWFSKDKLPKYFAYKKKSRNELPLTPTLKLLSKREVSKAVEKLRKIIEKLNKKAGYPLLPVNWDDNIVNELEDILRDIGSNESILLTIKFGDRYIGDLKEVISIVEKTYEERGKESIGKAVCSVCLEEKEVSGDISPYKFYTIDKPGYISGGFDKSIAYKNFPLCYECKRYIEEGKKLIEKKLTFNLFGFRYQLIPEFIVGEERLVREVMEILLRDEVRKLKLSGRERKVLLSDEGEILDLLSEEGNFLSLNLLFIESQRSTSAERILLHLQDIYPSRLKQLFEAKDIVERFLGLESFTYGTIYRFFSKSDPSKRNPNLQKYFLEIVDRTFRGIRVEERFLIRFLLSRIRDSIKRSEEGYAQVIKDALAVFLFVKLCSGEVEMKDGAFKNFDDFLRSLPALDTDIKKALFLIGALTESLLDVQQEERKSKPFLKKLKGLKMSENDLKGLLPEVRIKLEEYGRYGAGEDKLFKLASKYLSKAPSKWNMSVEEMNFYFALGMGMFEILAEFIYNKEGNDEE